LEQGNLMLNHFWSGRSQRRNGRGLNSKRTTTFRSGRLRSLSTAETLEARAMLAATPLGEILEISNASQQVIAADIAQTSTGTSLIAYTGHNQANRLSGNDREILIQSITADGSVGDLITVNSASRGDQSDPVIATDDNGDFMVVWSGRGEGDRSGIFGQRYAASGTAIGEQFRINTTRCQRHLDATHRSRWLPRRERNIGQLNDGWHPSLPCCRNG
jgi:hypothetical protein